MFAPMAFSAPPATETFVEPDVIVISGTVVDELAARIVAPLATKHSCEPSMIPALLTTYVALVRRITMTFVGLAARATLISAWRVEIEPEVSLTLITTSPEGCSTNPMLGEVYSIRCTPWPAKSRAAENANEARIIPRMVRLACEVICVAKDSPADARRG